MATQTLSPDFVSADGKLSADFWATMPETKPYYELIEGVLKRKMPARNRHARAAFQLAFQLALWGEAVAWVFQTEGLGLRADAFNGFVPDVVGFAPDSHPSGDAVYTSSAFLVAEVLSPATATNDRDAKKRGYAQAEVELYLIVDAAQKRVEIYRLNGAVYGESETLSDDAVWQPSEFAGLQLELAKLWM